MRLDKPAARIKPLIWQVREANLLEVVCVDKSGSYPFWQIFYLVYANCMGHIGRVSVSTLNLFVGIEFQSGTEPYRLALVRTFGRHA